MKTEVIETSLMKPNPNPLRYEQVPQGSVSQHDIVGHMYAQVNLYVSVCVVFSPNEIKKKNEIGVVYPSG